MNEKDHENDNIKVEVVDTDKHDNTDKQVNGEISNNSYRSKQHFYQGDTIPPVYMSTVAQSSSVYTTYSHEDVSKRLQYVTANNDYREYQKSPPDIDKAPTFVHRINGKNIDNDNQSNSTTPPSPSTTPPDDKHVWSKAEVELLLDLYEQNKDQLKDPRVRKTKIWDDIAKKIHERLDSEVNGCQCNQKFRNLKADFQKVLEHNGRPGNFKRVCKYYDRLAHLLDYTFTPNGFRSPRPAAYPPVESALPPAPEQIESSRHQVHRDYHYENLHTQSQTKHSNKRKYQENGTISQNGNLDNFYFKKSKANCSCDCNQEILYLRESIERINNYVLARSAHEEERLRRLEEIHREKLISMTRFMDIFKDYIHKMA